MLDRGYIQHKTDHTTIVAGDFNASFQANDRASGVKSPQDGEHRAFMAQHGLAPVSRPSLAPPDEDLGNTRTEKGPVKTNGAALTTY
jgi:hypothetical protein